MLTYIDVTGESRDFRTFFCFYFKSLYVKLSLQVSSQKHGDYFLYRKEFRLQTKMSTTKNPMPPKQLSLTLIINHRNLYPSSIFSSHIYTLKLPLKWLFKEKKVPATK